MYRLGKSFRSEKVTLRALWTGGPASRFGFTASRTLGGAVVRNRVKRRLREIVGALPVAKGWDIVLSARTQAVGAEYGSLASSDEALMRKAGVLE